MGERSFGMGSAAVATDGDTGIMFTNPASLAWESADQVSASVSAFQRIDVRNGEYISVFKSVQDNIKKTGFVGIPSLIGGHVKESNWVWGGTILVPDSFQRSEYFESGTGIISFDAKDQSFWFGAFAAQKVEEEFSIGFSAYYVSRESREKFLFVDRESLIRFRSHEQGYGAGSYVGIVGLTWEISPQYRIGCSFRPPPYALGGKVFVIDSSSASNELKVKNPSLKFVPLPARVSAGVMWKPNSRWTAAFDMHWFSSIDGNLGDQTTPELYISASQIVNANLGIEWKAFEVMGFRAGALTNLSSARAVPNYLTVLNDKVDMFGGTLGVVWNRPAGTFSLGGYMQTGHGKAPELSDVPSRSVRRSNHLYGIVVGSAYHF